MAVPLSPRPSARLGLLAACHDLEVDPARRQVVVAGRPVRLTPLELDLACVLAEAPGRTWAREELAARLGMRAGPGSRALDNLVMRLRRKLGDLSRSPVFIEAVWGIGYRLRERSPLPAAHRVWVGAVAFEALPFPAFVTDADRRVVLLNAAARRLWGVSDDQEIGCCADVVGCHTRTLASLAVRCPAALARGTTVRCTYLARDGSHAEYVADTTYVRLADEAGGPAHFLAVHRPRAPVRAAGSPTGAAGRTGPHAWRRARGGRT
ncbi:MAG: winged helix-turn-helix domain-containing protein [Armatimonadota bacterium]|nr:winged helix-turn-helix domain-containing protein [Armatimonadota bacterium]MDR7486016.1 winged helix-turn-helix domain-containing protein [Armatimonadota bacterium]MDR7532587.1 winged helix-turn-helix domain-containing protein [Armatimonadota bacterium]MDR7536204.1 winged helix-turn-helix domain-containing protein [Armatimonadota bacterium]